MCHSTVQVPLCIYSPVLKETDTMASSQVTDLSWWLLELSGVGMSDSRAALTSGQYVSQITGWHVTLGWWGLEGEDPEQVHSSQGPDGMAAPG